LRFDYETKLLTSPTLSKKTDPAEVAKLNEQVQSLESQKATMETQIAQLQTQVKELEEKATKLEKMSAERGQMAIRFKRMYTSEKEKNDAINANGANVSIQVVIRELGMYF
jgi:predicted  nucleic acid-binding Zn-ribbon protein